jgi:archaemetzincin
MKRTVIRVASVDPDIDPGVLRRLVSRLPPVFSARCEIDSLTLDTSAAFLPARNQYFSAALLSQMHRIPLTPATRILGITSLDLCVPVLTFAFGEAQLGGPCAIVSIHRLRDEFYGLPGDGDRLEERLLKEAVHELGHTFGLRHCDNWACAMSSSHSVERLDYKTAEFCDTCRMRAAIERLA